LITNQVRFWLRADVIETSPIAAQLTAQNLERGGTYSQPKLSTVFRSEYRRHEPLHPLDHPAYRPDLAH
jgi:hypothetical protein